MVVVLVKGRVFGDEIGVKCLESSLVRDARRDDMGAAELLVYMRKLMERGLATGDAGSSFSNWGIGNEQCIAVESVFEPSLQMTSLKRGTPKASSSSHVWYATRA